MFCPKCGEVIDDKAVICPKCGASTSVNSTPQNVPMYTGPAYSTPPVEPKKKKKGCLIALLIVGGLIVLVIIISLVSGGGDNKTTTDTNGNTVTTTKETKVPIVVTVDDLVDALNNNALKASNTYKDKYVELTGKVSTIDSSGDYFSLGILGNDDFSIDTVLCNINKEQLTTVSNFKTGQKVTVIGTITDVGEIMGYTLDVESIK